MAATYEEIQKYLAMGVVLGKREMLLYIQKSAVASIGNFLTLEEINSFVQVCEIDEMVFNTECIEGEVRRDMRLESTAIARGKKE